jgi:hypothetical protein
MASASQFVVSLLAIGVAVGIAPAAQGATPESPPSTSAPRPVAADATQGPVGPTDVAATPNPGSATEPPAGSADEPTTAEACAGPCWDEVFRRSSLGFGMGVGVAYLPEMAGVNERIGRAGYDELAAFTSYFTMSVPLSIDHFMLLAQVRLTSVSSDDETTRYESLHGMLSAGWSITPPELLAIYPFAGIGIASATLTLGQTTPLGASFDSVLAGSHGPLELDALALVGTTGMAAELLVARTDDHPTRGIFIGARLGVTATFTASDWSLGSGLGSVPDGPRPPLGGYFAELNAGLRL